MLANLFLNFLFHPLVFYLLITLLALILIALFIHECQEFYARIQSRRRNVPYVRVPSQIIQVALKNRFDLIENDYLKKYGPVYGCLLWNEFTITICDPELVQIVCTREFTKMANRRRFQSHDPVFDNILFSTNDDKWKRLRAIMSPTFSAGKLRKVKFCIDHTVQTMMKHLEEKIQEESFVNVKEVIGAFTMDTIIQMAFGVQIDSLRDPNSKIIQVAKKMFSQDLPVKDILFFAFANLCPTILKIFNWRFQVETFDYFEGLSRNIIQKKREELKNRTGKASNFIELILEVEQEQNEQIEMEIQKENSINKQMKYVTNEEILAQCVTFFTVGYDTTATSIVNTCYLLAANPDKQEKLHRNIMKTLEKLAKEQSADDSTTDPFQLITFDSVNKFEYLNACLNESMRLYTIGTATERACTEDFHIETADKKIQFDVKKGDIIRIGISKMHLDPNYFSNPDKFIPERFLPNSPEPVFNKHAFLPFGNGPRSCLARHLAQLEAKMALAHLFRVFRFKLHPKATNIDFFVNADFNISIDVHLQVEKR